jgi:hypothetical protein
MYMLMIEYVQGEFLNSVIESNTCTNRAFDLLDGALRNDAEEGLPEKDLFMLVASDTIVFHQLRSDTGSASRSSDTNHLS